MLKAASHSEHTVKNLLQVMKGKGLLIKVSTGPVKRPTSYLLNFDIPGDVLVGQGKSLAQSYATNTK